MTWTRTMMRRLGWPVLLALAVCAQPARADDSAFGNPYVELAQRADALVTVQFVVKVQMPGVDQEAESEIVCVTIAADGLVLCSNTELGGYFGVMARMMGRSDAPISAAPTDIRVVLGDGEDGLDAVLVARDSDRDLAWLLIKDPPEDREIPYLDFSDHAAPVVGSRLYRLRRLSPFFGSTPVVSEDVVAGVTDRPRTLIVPSRPDGQLGMPAFAGDGRLLGLFVAQVPGNDDRSVMGLRSRSLPGQPGTEQDMIAGVILPADDVVKATELARQVWAEDQRDALE